jgi:molybdopterin-biosynthesis enzyme MoeA-like protein
MDDYQSFRKGDMVQAKQKNAEVPEGTIGMVTNMGAAPGFPKTYLVEWRLPNYPHMKRGWYHQGELMPLTGGH